MRILYRTFRESGLNPELSRNCKFSILPARAGETSQKTWCPGDIVHKMVTRGRGNV